MRRSRLALEDFCQKMTEVNGKGTKYDLRAPQWPARTGAPPSDSAWLNFGQL